MTDITIDQPDPGPRQQVVLIRDLLTPNEYTNSLDLATMFGRLHFNILQSARVLESRLALDSRYHGQHIRWDTVKTSRGRTLPIAWFSTKGLTLLALGFTGSATLPPRVDLSNQVLSDNVVKGDF